jgi:hypothetical protein
MLRSTQNRRSTGDHQGDKVPVMHMMAHHFPTIFDGLSGRMPIILNLMHFEQTTLTLGKLITNNSSAEK